MLDHPQINRLKKGYHFFMGIVICLDLAVLFYGLEQALCHQEFDVAEARMVVGEVWKTIPVDVSG